MGSSSSKPNRDEQGALSLTPEAMYLQSSDDAFDKPWRPINWSDREQMFQKLKAFQSAQELDHLRILIVGPAGSGKSCFITSFNSAVQGRNTYLAYSQTGGVSDTRKYTVYKVNKGTDEAFFPFVFCDTMGLEEGSSGARTEDIIRILHGQMQEGSTFNTEQTPESNDFNGTPGLNVNIHCLVFVLAAETIFQMPEGVLGKMKHLLKEARKLGIPQAVIMSKVDTSCPLVKVDLKRIYESKKVKAAMETCSVLLGVPVKYIFPVKNYHEEITTNNETDILIFTAVSNMVDFANDFVKRME